MGGPGRETGRNPGEGSRSILLISDPHFFSGDSDPDKVVEDVVSYRERLDCDGLVIAGDVGSLEDLERFQETGFDWIKAAEGNHDDWGGDLDDIELDTELRWTEQYPDGEIAFSIQHDPRDFGLSAVEEEGSGEYEPDVLVYGHSHMPYDRVLDDGSVAICAGSIAQNYSTKDDLPDKSFYEIEVGDDICVRHYDFETDELVEEAFYEPQDDGSLRLSSRLWTWEGGNEREDRFYEESL